MNIGGYLDGEITRSQATKEMKAAGYEYGQPDFWKEFNECFERSEAGFYLIKRQPKKKERNANGGERSQSATRRSHLDIHGGHRIDVA